MKRAHDKSGFADPFVKIKCAGDFDWLWKSDVQKQTLTPKWNQTETVSHKSKTMPHKFIVEIWDQDSLINDFIGKAEINVEGSTFRELLLPLHGKDGQLEAEVDLKLVIEEVYEYDNMTNPLFQGSNRAENPLYM